MKLINQLIRLLKAVYISLLGILFGKKLEIPYNKKILIISPHPDDEIFGCGNLIYSSIKNNNKLLVLFLSKGEKSTPLVEEKDLIENRRRMAVMANNLVGNKNIFFLDFPDNNFDSVNDDQIDKLMEFINDSDPDIIFYPHILDYNLDHREASHIISKLIEEKSNIRKYYYCVWLWESLPYKDLKKISIRNIYFHSPKCNYKKESHDIYTKTHSSNNVFYSGSCPKMLYLLTKRKKELFFLVE